MILLIALLGFFSSCDNPSSSKADDENQLVTMLNGIPDISLDLIVPQSGSSRYTYVSSPSDPIDVEDWLDGDLDIFYVGMMTALKNKLTDTISASLPSEDAVIDINTDVAVSTDDGDFTIYLFNGKYILTDNGIKLYLTLANTASDTKLRMYIHHYLETGNTKYTTDYLLSQAADDSDLNFFRYAGEESKSYVGEMWVDNDTGDIDTNYYEYEIVDTSYSNLSLFHKKVNSSGTELDKNVLLVYTRASGYSVWQKDIVGDPGEDKRFYSMSGGSLDAAYTSWASDFSQAIIDWPAFSETQAANLDISSMIPDADSTGFADLFN